MIIAKQKRRSNIAEYILYMWQVEDIIRACSFNIDIIKKQIVDSYKVDEQTTTEIMSWYESLIHMMNEQGITEKGHLAMLVNNVQEISDFHNNLLQDTSQSEYRKTFQLAQHNILLFKAKSGLNAANDIDVCLNALYSLLLLRISKKDVSEATNESMETFSRLLALLAQKFNEWENGKLEISS